MTKKKIITIACLLGCGIAFISVDKKSSGVLKTFSSVLQSTIQKSASPSALTSSSTSGMLESSFTKEELSRAPSSIIDLSTLAEPWGQYLYSALKTQGGPNFKEAHIKKESSFEHKQDGNNIFVESVVVILKNQKDEESSFRALVDADTGKVLETWDHSISDPANVRDGFKFKLDPRYNN